MDAVHGPAVPFTWILDAGFSPFAFQQCICTSSNVIYKPQDQRVLPDDCRWLSTFARLAYSWLEYTTLAHAQVCSSTGKETLLHRNRCSDVWPWLWGSWKINPGTHIKGEWHRLVWHTVTHLAKTQPSYQPIRHMARYHRTSTDFSRAHSPGIGCRQYVVCEYAKRRGWIWSGYDPKYPSDTDISQAEWIYIATGKRSASSHIHQTTRIDLAQNCLFNIYHGLSIPMLLWFEATHHVWLPATAEPRQPKAQNQRKSETPWSGSIGTLPSPTSVSIGRNPCFSWCSLYVHKRSALVASFLQAGPRYMWSKTTTRSTSNQANHWLQRNYAGRMGSKQSQVSHQRRMAARRGVWVHWRAMQKCSKGLFGRKLCYILKCFIHIYGTYLFRWCK